MNPDVLEKVLSCQRLPSLPAVAVRVLELTGDRNVSFNELAATITNDQGLASKVLRTVNSSFYALRKPCSSINQAIVMLGLSAVKTLALGFSLVSSLAKTQSDGFDLQAYWRRALISGIAGKCIAAEARTGNDEECFLGGLLQDVGMVALYQALGDEYAAILRDAGPVHANLLKLELAALETSHTEVGALLATRWKLPQELIMPVRFHERPTAAPQEYLRIVQAVALGNIAAELLTSAESGPVLRRFYDKAEQWFAIKNNRADELLKKVGQGVGEISRLLAVSTGEVIKADEVLAQASGQLRAIEMPFDGRAEGTPATGESAAIDADTGLPTRRVFNQNLVTAFERFTAGGPPVGVAILAIDQLEELRDQGPHIAKAAMSEAAQVLRPAFDAETCLLTRFDETTLAAIIPDRDRAAATRALEAARARLASTTLLVRPPGLMAMPMTLTTSAGLAVLDEASRDRFKEPDELVAVASRALLAAERGGAGSLRVYAPKAAA